MLSTVCKLWCGRRARPKTRHPHKASLHFDTLEARAVPTIAFTPHFGAESLSGSNAYSLQHPTVDFVFSGSYWNTT